MDNETRGLYFSFFNEIGIIGQLSRAMMEVRMPTGFLLTHFSVLNHLMRVGDGRTPLSIAKAFQVPKTSMTHTLSGLESQGFVEMRPNPKDRRSKCVWLTTSGRRFRDETIAKLEPDLVAFQAAFPAEAIEALVPRLTEIRQMMDAYRDESD